MTELNCCWGVFFFFFCNFNFRLTSGSDGLAWRGLVSSGLRQCFNRRAFPCLHAHAEGVQLMVEVLGGFWQNLVGVQAGVPDTAEAQRDLFDQVEQRVALHAHRLVRIIFHAFFGDGQDAEARASQSRDGHQIMGPYDVTFGGTERTELLDWRKTVTTIITWKKQNGLTMYNQYSQLCTSPCQQHQWVFVATVTEVGEVRIIPQKQEVSQCFVVLLWY